MDKDKEEAREFARQIDAEASFEARIMALPSGMGRRRETPFQQERRKLFNALGCCG